MEGARCDGGYLKTFLVGHLDSTTNIKAHIRQWTIAMLVYALESTDSHGTIANGRELTVANLASESRGHVV